MITKKESLPLLHVNTNASPTEKSLDEVSGFLVEPSIEPRSKHLLTSKT